MPFDGNPAVTGQVASARGTLERRDNIILVPNVIREFQLNYAGCARYAFSLFKANPLVLGQDILVQGLISHTQNATTVGQQFFLFTWPFDERTLSEERLLVGAAISLRFTLDAGAGANAAISFYQHATSV